MYNHKHQFRCPIIRGKSKTDMDDLLPTYALIIDDICPCLISDFEYKFNKEFSKTDTISQDLKKTLDNHRTEIAGKLFGMYYVSDNIVFSSERTKKFLEDNDQPAFFKEMCYKFQFPNGMNKSQTLLQLMEKNISCRPMAFVLKTLKLSETLSLELSVKDVGYYVLNSLDVLQGIASVEEVVSQIKHDNDDGIKREIIIPDKATSFTMQHIREQLNYLELANLIQINNGILYLNHKEDVCLTLFTQQCGVKPEFDVYSYDVNTIEGRRKLYSDWNLYYSKITNVTSLFETKVSALVDDDEKDNTIPNNTSSDNCTELGDAGEALIFEYEKKRVAAYNPRLLGKVIACGKQKGLGYDIQSVIAENCDSAEFVKYIEVKSTKRVTPLHIDDDTWSDTLNITRNEFIAAMQHKNYYSIYRVYFTRNSIFVFVINNISLKAEQNLLRIVPTMYRMDFSRNAVDKVFGVKNV